MGPNCAERALHLEVSRGPGYPSISIPKPPESAVLRDPIRRRFFFFSFLWDGSDLFSQLVIDSCNTDNIKTDRQRILPKISAVIGLISCRSIGYSISLKALNRTFIIVPVWFPLLAPRGSLRCGFM